MNSIVVAMIAAVIVGVYVGLILGMALIANKKKRKKKKKYMVFESIRCIDKDKYPRGIYVTVFKDLNNFPGKIAAVICEGDIMTNNVIIKDNFQELADDIKKYWPESEFFLRGEADPEKMIGIYC